MNILKVNFVKLNSEAQVPLLGTAGSGCYDLYSIQESDIQPGEIKPFDTGIAIEVLEPEIHMLIFSRSGNAFKRNLIVLTPGVIDNDFRGEIKVLLYNLGKETVHIKKGERIAQMCFVHFRPVEFQETKQLTTTGRQDKGFGSTDV